MTAGKQSHSSWRTLARGELPLLCLIALVFLCLWAFVGIAGEAREGEHDRLEARILRSFRQPGDPAQLIGPSWLGEVVRDVSALGGASVTVLVAALILGALFLNRRHRAALTIIAAIAGGSVLNILLKHLFIRARPEVVPHLVEVSDASFPSGHSMNAAITYITLGVLLAQGTASWGNKLYFIGASVLLSCLIGTCRVMLGVHYPSDVLGGWAAGAAWALLCWVGADLFNRRKPA